MKKKQKHKKPSHPIIDNNLQARENLDIINPYFSEAGLPTLAIKQTEEPSVLILEMDELQILNTIESEKVKELVNLILKIHSREKRDTSAINVIFSGDAHTGIVCVGLMEKVLGLHLKSLPYNPLYRGKHYENKGLFIIASDLPVAELNRGFPREYTDVIVLNKTTNTVEDD